MSLILIMSDSISGSSRDERVPVDRQNRVTVNEKNVVLNEKSAIGASTIESLDQWTPPEDWLERFKDEYSGQHHGETLPPGSDPHRVAVNVFTLNEEQSVKTLETTIVEHANDYTFDLAYMNFLKTLVQGPQAAGLDEKEWAYTICRNAGMVHNWSPYAEVRSVTVP